MGQTNLNHLRDRAYMTACDHEPHNEGLSDHHQLMLVVTELSDAVSADRISRRANRILFPEYHDDYNDEEKEKLFKNDYEDFIKDTVEDYLANAVIRMLDLCGLREIDAYTVPIILAPSCHTFTEHMHYVCGILTDRFFDSDPDTLTYQLSQAMSYILSYSGRYDMDLLWYVKQKMRYNELLPKMN